MSVKKLAVAWSLGLVACAGRLASAQEAKGGLLDAVQISGGLSAGVGLESARQGALDAQRALQGELRLRRPSVYAGGGAQRREASRTAASSAPAGAQPSVPGLHVSEPPPPSPGEKPGREAGMGGEFLTGAIFAGAALALMFTPYAGIVKIAAAAAGAIIGAIAGYRAEKPMTGDKKMEAIMLGAQLLGLGLYAPPAIAFIAGAIAATPILRLIDKIRGR